MVMKWVGCKKILSLIPILYLGDLVTQSVSVARLILEILLLIIIMNNNNNNNNKNYSRIIEGYYKDNVCKLRGTDTWST